MNQCTKSVRITNGEASGHLDRGLFVAHSKGAGSLLPPDHLYALLLFCRLHRI